jgi:predicted nucleic acid-binding protein
LRRFVVDASTVLDDPAEVTALLRDPDDDYLVTLARTAGAEAIITGDRDLLDHHGLQPPAIDARAACELIGLT